MNTYDSLKVNSYIATDQLLVKNKTYYETDVTTKAEAESFSGLLASLLSYSNRMDESLSWLVEEKNAIRESVISQVLIFSNALQCLADSLSDTSMFEKVLVSQAELGRMSEIKFISYTKQVISLSRKHLDELAPYGVSEAKLVSLETDFTSFLQKLEELIIRKDAKKDDKKGFSSLKKEINSLLNNKLDRRIENLRASYPEFVSQYFSLRKVSRPAHHSYDLLGYITDAATGKPIAYGTAWLEELDMKANITQTGTFRFKSIPSGKYQLRVENMDYKTLYVPISRYAPEKLKLNLQMEALPVEQTQPA
ncbi:carboxypeptidase-like protein [Ancylomarina subtilis]|uniref:Carboxypeptidase-like protein n=1 Tax=Ancylomarina subtilis TaxID=1639035 RepID=A0A4V2FSX1_9BACT|nr:carboxypeptidase-like regulatory domain-containing protein [Ancylomarina subtilis]RZT95925.1 carboxypeptidase-like protein [Ancylomarina subtilis]